MIKFMILSRGQALGTKSAEKISGEQVVTSSYESI